MRALLIAAAVAGSLGGSSIGWFTRGLVADHLQIPAVIQRLDQQCELATEKAAAEAVAAEQLRQFKIGERATQRFIEESQAAADDAQARQDVLELEIEIYAQGMRAGGAGVCALDDAALELIGVRRAAKPDQPGGR